MGSKGTMDNTPRMSNRSKPSSEGLLSPSAAAVAARRRFQERVRGAGSTTRAAGQQILQTVESADSNASSAEELTIQGLVATLLNGDRLHEGVSSSVDDRSNSRATFDDTTTSGSSASRTTRSSSSGSYSYESARHSNSLVTESRSTLSSTVTSNSIMTGHLSSGDGSSEGEDLSSNLLSPTSSQSTNLAMNSTLTSVSAEESLQTSPRLRLSLTSWAEQEAEDADAEDEDEDEDGDRDTLDTSILEEQSEERGEEAQATGTDNTNSTGGPHDESLSVLSLQSSARSSLLASSDTTQPTSPGRARLVAAAKRSPTTIKTSRSRETKDRIALQGEAEQRSFEMENEDLTALLPPSLSSSAATGRNSKSSTMANVGVASPAASAGSSPSTKGPSRPEHDATASPPSPRRGKPMMATSMSHGSGAPHQFGVLSGADADDELTIDTQTDVLSGTSATTLEEEVVRVASGGSHELANLDKAGLDPSGSASSQGRKQKRVPGGAAAKLILLGPQDSNDENTDTDGEIKSTPSQETAGAVEDSLREIELQMVRARQEFEIGTAGNRRYQPVNYEEDPENSQTLSHSASATRSFLNKSDIYYETAAQAVAALLAPREQPIEEKVRPSGSSSNQGMIFSTVSADHSVLSRQSNTSSAFQAPDASSAITPGSAHRMNPSYQSFGRRDVSESLITARTERKLEEIKNRMHDPNKTLADLLAAIATPENPAEMDQGYMVRRKNACGALKVLTNDPRKRLKICWTVGVLPALTSVLADSGELGLMATFPDKRIRAEYEAARDRSISALLNLTVPKENRIPVFHTPSLIWAIIRIILDDKGSARRGCTTILAYLAKSVENRLLLPQCPGFFGSLVAVLQPMPARLEPAPKTNISPAKKSYPWSGDSSESEEDSSSSNKEQKPANSEEDDSEKTPRIVASKSPVELSGYDETADELLKASRQNVFAILGHLVKEKDNTYHFARDSTLLNTLVDITGYQESPSHTFAIKLLAHLTRHRMNTKLMVFQERRTVPALVQGANSETDETRLYSCFALQNLSQDKSCRQELAMIDNLVPTLCSRGRFSSLADERLAAISALKNLCDEPANLIPLTNTPECISTLMHLAHGKEQGVTETMQYRACDALATLSHWLRKIATSGRNLDEIKRGRAPDKKLFVPSLRVITWNQWQ